MKKWWICVVIWALTLTCMPVSASEVSTTSLSVVDVMVRPGTNTVDIYFNYDTTEYLLDGGFFITFPADKVMPEFGGPISPTNPAKNYCLLPQAMVNTLHLEEGYFRMSFIDGASFSVTGRGQVAKISFRILDPSVEGSYPIHFYADRLVKWVDYSIEGENLVSDETPIEDIGYITVTADGPELGDVDGDGQITSTDSRLILQYAVDKVWMADLHLPTADADGDGVITSTDARLVLQVVSGKLPALPQ